MGRTRARVLITGCSTGIGRATARKLTDRGYEVIATARRVESLDDLEVAARLPLDVDDDASVAAAVEAAGDIHVLVNNAGHGVYGPVETVPLEPVRSMFETNVFGVIRMVQAVAPQMRRRGDGTIVNVSSMAGRISTPLNGAYAATKHAVEALSEAMRYELGHFGIRVAIIEPGYVATAWAENERWLGIEDTYADLRAQVETYDREAEVDASDAEMVARVIAEAVESDDPRLRWPAGADAEVALQARSQVDDARWEQMVRDTIRLDW